MSFAKEVYDKFHAIDVSGMVEKKQGLVTCLGVTRIIS